MHGSLAQEKRREAHVRILCCDEYLYVSAGFAEGDKDLHLDQYFDLFVWSVLNNRKEMALVFWEQTKVTPRPRALALRSLHSNRNDLRFE